MEVRMNASGISLSKTIIIVERKSDIMVHCFVHGQKISGIANFTYAVPTIEAIALNTPYEADVEYDYEKKKYKIRFLKETQPISRDDMYESHPSWGVASLHHVSSGRSKLFGAIAYYGSHYTLKINPARVMKANVSHSERNEIDGFRLPLIEVAFTKEQLLNLIVGLNNGNGQTPCTVEFYNNESIKYQRENFNSLECELENVRAKWTADNSVLFQSKQNLIKLSEMKITKEVREEINKELEKVNGFMNGTMLYNLEHLIEYIEKLGLLRKVNMLPEVSTDHIKNIKQLRDEYKNLSLRDAHETLKRFNDNMNKSRNFLKEHLKESGNLDVEI